ncbi:MAG: hypothetical protein HY049_07455 [Acidobacteria bacterium]|nr:hypothetical protein [Acidobacteriota bacterium]
MSCGRTQEFLAKRKIESRELRDAKKQTIGGSEALKLVLEMDEIYVAKGSKLVHIDVKKDRPDAATLKALVIGPTGNLRAPCVRIGRTMLIGFSEEAYLKVLA